MYYTQLVYNDFQNVQKFVDSTLNKSGTRYSTSTSFGSYTASFKSACGDYKQAIDYVNNNYLNGLNELTRSYFSSSLLDIKNNMRDLIDSYMQNITLRYKYYVNNRSGYSKYDNWHSAVAGSYSCSYVIPRTCIGSSTSCDKEGHCSTSYYTYDCSITRTASGTCYTYGTAITSPCTASCSGYINAHWGSQPNPCGDYECDVSNDWDAQCNGNYTWYTTWDNYGTHGYKKIDGTYTQAFQSWGGYSCDNFYLTPTGTSTTKCIYGKHDQYDNYVNREKVSSGSWSSVAKRLIVSTYTISFLEDSLMKNLYYRDYFEKSPYISGNDNVRYDLAIDVNNGINKYADNYIRPIIYEKLKNLYLEFYKRYYTNLFTMNQGDKDKDLFNLIEKIYNKYIQQSKDDFPPFNRIIIKDGEIAPENKYAVNFDIKLPGGHYVLNPNAFSFTIAPHKEIRKYRCYYDWDKCDVEEGCKLKDTKYTNFITDSDGKSVPILKNERYECKDKINITTCKNLKLIKECSNIPYIKQYIDYDDFDFSEEFQSSLGKIVALNEGIKLFNGQELRCENGLFTDFSWLQDPMFWLSAFNALASHVQGLNNLKEGMLAWVQTATASVTEGLSCASLYANCLNDAGFSPVSLVTNMFSGDVVGIGKTDQLNDVTDMSNFTAASNQCAQYVASDASEWGGPSCASWAVGFSSDMAAFGSKLAQNLNGVATSLGFASGKELLSVMGDPLTSFIIMTVYNLVFNTFDDCDQCTNLECAQSHSPNEAVATFKMINGKNIKTKYEGNLYGLGEGFVAYNNCFFKESGCAAKFLKACYRNYESYCCYNSRITRILVGQIYQQLGYSFQKDGCNAISLEDLNKIDFTSCPEGSIPSPANKCINYKELREYLIDKMNWDTKKTFDLSTPIQAIINDVQN